MAKWFALDATEIDQLQETMEEFGSGSGQIVDGVLHGEGAELIKQNIARILPSSGRRWKKKGASARVAMPGKFKQDNGQLAVTIAARGKYGYLYFPDDGTNTRRHAGNQQFMKRGAEESTARIIELCVGKLLEQGG